MRSQSDSAQSGQILLGIGIALLVVFLGLVVYQKIAVGRLRFVASDALIAELAGAVFLDDDPTPGDWPQWRGKNRDGITSMPDLLRSWPGNGPPRKWRVPGGDGYSSFSVQAGRIFSMLVTEDDKEAVVCWDLATGKERWRRIYEPGASFDYGGPRATPTIDGNRLYTVSASGQLMCLTTDKGEVVWQRDLREVVGAEPPRWGFAFSPLIDGQYVFVTPGGRKGRCLAAFDKDSGKLVWTSEDDPAGYSSPVAASIGGVRQIIYLTGRRLLGVAADDGRRLWEYPWLTQFEVNAATPVAIRAKIGNKEIVYLFISSGYKKGCALVRIAPTSQDNQFEALPVYESNELCCHFASPVRYKDHLYGLDEERDLTCVDLRTGKAVWRFERTDDAEEGSLRNVGFKKGSLLRVDDVLLVLGEDGKLALVEATHQAYREIAACRPLRDRCWAMPIIAEGMLLLRDRRQVIGLDVRKNEAR
jgi:outer membrane protein assembly factor BamB